jgi:hypothetical protein
MACDRTMTMVKSEIVLSIIFLEDRAKTINPESKSENPNFET